MFNPRLVLIGQMHVEKVIQLRAAPFVLAFLRCLSGMHYLVGPSLSFKVTSSHFTGNSSRSSNCVEELSLVWHTAHVYAYMKRCAYVYGGEVVCVCVCVRALECACVHVCM